MDRESVLLNLETGAGISAWMRRARGCGNGNVGAEHRAALQQLMEEYERGAEVLQSNLTECWDGHGERAVVVDPADVGTPSTVRKLPALREDVFSRRDAVRGWRGN